MESMPGERRGWFAEAMSDKRMKGSVLLLVLVLSTFLFIKAISEAKAYRFIGSGTTATNTLAVSGKGEVFAVPDIVEFSYSVIEENMSVSTAQTNATKKSNDIKAFLKENGVEEKDIQTSGYNIAPRYDWVQRSVVCPAGSYCPPSGEQVLKGYTVTDTVTVKVRNTEKAGDLLAGVGSRGAKNVSGLNFTFDDEDAVLDEARNEAIADARVKAKELANQLGVSLIRVVNFSESGQPQPYYAMKEMSLQAADARGGAAVPAPSISVGENKIVSNVTIVYEIR